METPSRNGNAGGLRKRESDKPENKIPAFLRKQTTALHAPAFFLNRFSHNAESNIYFFEDCHVVRKQRKTRDT
jgi:hypothetical protein